MGAFSDTRRLCCCCCLRGGIEVVALSLTDPSAGRFLLILIPVAALPKLPFATASALFPLLFPSIFLGGGGGGLVLGGGGGGFPLGGGGGLLFFLIGGGGGGGGLRGAIGLELGATGNTIVTIVDVLMDLILILGRWCILFVVEELCISLCSASPSQIFHRVRDKNNIICHNIYIYNY